MITYESKKKWFILTESIQQELVRTAILYNDNLEDLDRLLGYECGKYELIEEEIPATHEKYVALKKHRWTLRTGKKWDEIESPARENRQKNIDALRVFDYVMNRFYAEERRSKNRSVETITFPLKCLTANGMFDSINDAEEVVRMFFKIVENFALIEETDYEPVLPEGEPHSITEGDFKIFNKLEISNETCTIERNGSSEVDWKRFEWYKIIVPTFIWEFSGDAYLLTYGAFIQIRQFYKNVAKYGGCRLNFVTVQRLLNLMPADLDEVRVDSDRYIKDPIMNTIKEVLQLFEDFNYKDMKLTVRWFGGDVKEHNAEDYLKDRFIAIDTKGLLREGAVKSYAYCYGYDDDERGD